MKQSRHTLIILETKPFFETDKRCICFSKENGKIICLAKHVARSKKKVWSLEPLTIAAVTLYQGKSFQLITSYSVTQHFQNIRTSFNHLQYALFFTHIIKKCINEEQNNIKLYELTQQTLTLCNNLDPLNQIKSFFYNGFTQCEGIHNNTIIKNENHYLHEISNYLGYNIKPPLQLDERTQTLVK